MRTVLISGAGIAGATLAYWLARRGLRPTVVEQGQGIRSSGNPVDVRGPALPIVRAMGLLPALRDHATSATRLSVIGPDGGQVATLAGPNSSRGGSDSEVEIARADLARLLLDACRDVEVLFDDSVTELAEDRRGVDVRLGSGQQRRFDLVIGADGVHSVTRRLIFGPEQQFVRRLGMFVGTTAGLELGSGDNTAVRLYNAPGRLAAIHPGRGTQTAALIFRRPTSTPFDHLDGDQHRKMIMEQYADDGWLVPALLDRVRSTDDLYFDAVSRIDVPQWSRGRVGLVGDAASSVSLLGDGSTKAIIGAHTLAEELARTDDHHVALRRYQSRHAPMISSPARVRASAALLVPRTSLGLGARNAAARVAGLVTRR